MLICRGNLYWHSMKSNDRMAFKPSKQFGFESLKGFETFFVGLELEVPNRWLISYPIMTITLPYPRFCISLMYFSPIWMAKANQALDLIDIVY
jgi:hypothetical protein